MNIHFIKVPEIVLICILAPLTPLSTAFTSIPIHIYTSHERKTFHACGDEDFTLSKLMKCWVNLLGYCLQRDILPDKCIQYSTLKMESYTYLLGHKSDCSQCFFFQLSVYRTAVKGHNYLKCYKPCG